MTIFTAMIGGQGGGAATTGEIFWCGTSQLAVDGLVDVLPKGLGLLQSGEMLRKTKMKPRIQINDFHGDFKVG
ncbi:MAG: hypothetical protein HW380_3245 [Magnetococcales bacterium]|nr:hypothetical protein [Magnetococcales bacterium]